MSGSSEDKRRVGVRGIYKAVSSGLYKWEALGCQRDWYNQGQSEVGD